MKTILCPSCGAAATNLKNCEFCGSLFVRYDDHNLNPSSLFDENSEFIGFMFPGLENELRYNLSLQTDTSFIVTNVCYKEEVLLQIVQTTEFENMLGEGSISFPGVAIHIPFTSTREDEYNRFMGMEESKLFHTSYDSTIECHDFVLDFGDDSIGAAYLSSLYLIKQEGLNKTSMLKYDTSDFNLKQSNQSKGSSGCFIATATMGSYDHPEVMQLRNFRDNWILEKKWGEGFVAWYYHYGSIAAKSIEKSYVLKKLSYLLIVKPLIYLSRVVNR
jgi:hypothetical protein